MKRVATLSFLACVTMQGIAQEPQKPTNKDPNIRPAGDVILKFQQTIPVPEITRLDENGVLELFPGDEVHLEFEDDKGELVRPKVVASVTAPEKTISFKMTQDENMTILSRTSGIQKTVSMDCVHRAADGKEFFATNVRPTEKGMSSFDSWPNTVWILRLSKIETTSRSAAEVYQEKVSKSRGAPNSTEDKKK